MTRQFSEVLCIDSSSKVTLHFAVSLSGEDERELDSNFGKAPVSFVMGDGSLLIGFEQKLLGLSVGDKQTFQLTAAEGFGEHQQANIQRMKRSQFDESLKLETGLMISFAQQDGKELPGTVASFDEEEVYIDFNHPLAGRALSFAVEILAVEPVLPNNGAV